MTTTIFCPNCDALILAAPRCTSCGKWERPPALPPGRAAEVWRTALPARLPSSLTLADGVLYGCDGQGNLHALSAESGKPVWAAPAELGEWRVHRQVAVGAGVVVIGPADARAIPPADKAVLALDAATGRPRWRTPVGSRLVSDPAISGDAAYVATSDGHALGLSLTDGAVRWRGTLPGVCRAAPAAAPGLLVFASDNGALTALRPGADAAAWTFHVEPDPQWTLDLPYSPVYADGRIYVTCWNRRCYALDAQTGALIWVSEPTKRPPLTPPTVAGGRVYFCAHDRQVYCLDAATGALVWCTQLPRRSATTPLVLDGRVLLASEDHRVYALDAGTGKVQPGCAAETERHVEVDWAHDARCAYLSDAGGNVYAVEVRPVTAEPTGEALAAHGEWPAAARRYALEGNLRRAAEICAGPLHEPRHAGLLYEAAGERELAAQQFEAAGEAIKARDLYRLAGRLKEVARLSVRLRDQRGASEALEALGREHEAAGKWGEAGHAYEAAGLLAEAARCYQQAGDPLAPVLYARIGEHRRAAELFEQAAAWSQAAAEWRAVPRWKRAGETHEQAGEFEAAAEAYDNAGACDRAADCLRCAADGVQKRGEDDERAAALYERAMTAYKGCGRDDLAAECDRMRRWLRGQPWLVVPVPHAEEFVEGVSGRIDVLVMNDGWGLAKAITLTVSGQFERDLTRAQPFGLAKGVSNTQPIWVTPKQAGKPLPLHLEFNYYDAHGTPMPPFKISYDISVHRQDERGKRRDDSTPIIVESGGRLIQMLGSGDYMEEGYKATVERRTVASAAPAPDAGPDAPWNAKCSCGHEQPADRPKCEACGRPFVHCRTCGRHQAEWAQYCIHCGAAL